MELKEGDKIRLKVRTLGGWKGIGTVIFQQDDTVWVPP